MLYSAGNFEIRWSIDEYPAYGQHLTRYTVVVVGLISRLGAPQGQGPLQVLDFAALSPLSGK